MKRLRELLSEYAVLLTVLVGAPALCALAAGRSDLLADVFKIMPATHVFLAGHPEARWNALCPFSWTAFVIMGGISLALLSPFIRRFVVNLRGRGTPDGRRAARSFPWWGWLGVAVLVFGWIVAWNRFPWCTAVQRHTYLPIWLGFIVAVNGLVYRRSGRSPLSHDTGRYLALFPISSAFWWFFEYLNRYVWNWYYVGIGEMTSFEYLVFASLSFSTVLPGVMAVAEYLATFRLFGPGTFAGMSCVDFRSRGVVGTLVVGSLVGIVGIVLIPQFSYPFLWISPFMVAILVKTFLKRPCALDDVAAGDWSRIIRYAVAALLCGFVWELWNWHSLAKWIYAVPYVYRFHYFEMPLLGLFGYLPFGIECLVIADAWLPRPDSRR